MNRLDPVHAVQLAALFVWLGMVLAVSFVSAPLNLRGSGLSLAVGPRVGRIVVGTLAAAEALLALAFATCVIGTGLTLPASILLGVLVVLLLAQLLGPSRTLGRHPADGPPAAAADRRSARRAYLAIEIVKLALLVALGVLLLGGSAH